MAKFKVKYLGGLECEAQHLGNQASMRNGAPVDNHGKGDTFSPTDLVATALAECALITLAIYFKDQGLVFADTVCEIEKIMASSPPRRVAQIKCQFNFSHNFSAAEREQIERLVHKCPVAKSLHPDVEQVFSFNYPAQ